MSVAARLASARQLVADLEAKAASAQARSEAATPGGLTGYDPAILSGIRRKPNRKDDARRFGAYDREAALHGDLAKAQGDLAFLERRATREAAEAASRAELNPAARASARYVRTRVGWHKVIRVSAKSVTVETGYSWTDRIPLGDILEVRS